MIILLCMQDIRLQANMHTGYKGYKPIASNTMYYASWLQGLQASYKQHNIYIYSYRLQGLQANCKRHNNMHTGYKGYKPIANNTICDLTLEN